MVLLLEDGVELEATRLVLAISEMFRLSSKRLLHFFRRRLQGFQDHTLEPIPIFTTAGRR